MYFYRHKYLYLHNTGKILFFYVDVYILHLKTFKNSYFTKAVDSQFKNICEFVFTEHLLKKSRFTASLR